MIGQIIGAGLGAIGGIANIIGGGKAKRAAQGEVNKLAGYEPAAQMSSFYKSNVAQAQAAGTQQMDLANKIAGMSTDYAKTLQGQQAAFGQQYQAGAETAARQTERLGQMAFQRGLGPAGQMGMDVISQQGASALRGASDRRMAGGMAGGLLRSQQAGIQGLVGQGYQAATQGLGALMSASQNAANLRQQAMGTVYQSGLQAGQMGFGAQTAGIQGQQQAGLTGYQIGAQAGQQMAGAEERKQQADWESWANKYQAARGDLASAQQQQSSGWSALGSAAGSAIGGGLLGKAGKVAKVAKVAKTAENINVNNYASGLNPSSFGTNYMKFP
jgi:hypothetical protein